MTVPRWVDWLTLNFGYHVEYHLFPAASARHGRAIRAELARAERPRCLLAPCPPAAVLDPSLIVPRSGGP